jgi:hypothetical protein
MVRGSRGVVGYRWVAFASCWDGRLDDRSVVKGERHDPRCVTEVRWRRLVGGLGRFTPVTRVGGGVNECQAAVQMRTSCASRL